MSKKPVFDIGDTLVPSHTKINEVVQQQVRDAGYNDMPEFHINDYNIYRPAEVGEWLDENGFELDPEKVTKAYLDWKKGFLDENVIPVLEDISSSHGPIGFVSDNSVEAKEFYLEQFKDADIDFDGFVVSAEVGVEKPDVRIFEAFLSERDEAPENFVYFGNYVDRDKAAEKTGMGFVWVTQYYTFGSSYDGPTIERLTPESVSRYMGDDV